VHLNFKGFEGKNFAVYSEGTFRCEWFDAVSIGLDVFELQKSVRLFGSAHESWTHRGIPIELALWCSTKGE
jgi:hypothetical protein